MIPSAKAADRHLAVEPAEAVEEVKVDQESVIKNTIAENSE